MAMKYQELIDATVPYNGERFSGTYITHEVEPYREEVEKLHAVGRENGLVPYETGCWINVMRGKGALMERHNEGYQPGDVTIVMFLNTYEKDDGGELLVEQTDDATVIYTPKEGEWAMFPSDRYHQVTILNTDKPRITIAALFHKEVST